MNQNKMIPLITTEKFADAAAFYVDHFGFKKTFEADSFVGLQSEAKPQFELAFMPPGPDWEGPTQNCTLCLGVDNADKEFKRLKGLGVPIIQEPKDNPWGDRSFMVADPAGTVLYICHPIEPAPEFKDKFKE